MKRLRSLALLSGLVVAAAGCTKNGAAPGVADLDTVAMSSGSAAASAAPAGDVRIMIAPVKVGDRSTYTMDETATMKVEARPGQAIEVEQTKHTVRVVEVVAVDGGVATRARVSFPAISDTSTMGAERKDAPQPAAGKTYLVWREGTELHVTHEDGSPVSPEEKKVAGGVGDEIGHADPMTVIMASKTWKPGIKVDLTPAELDALNAEKRAEDDAPKAQAVSLTLTRADATTATFEMVAAIQLQNAKGVMRMVLTAAVTIERATGRGRELSGSGSMSGNLGMPVTGTMTAKATYTR
ncbi:MAG: hypothetical protein K8W52_25260 [Deltaproteobacteria bacterium]|nr:hypothetical protein [Deltaproteobacteria bacterium]